MMNVILHIVVFSCEADFFLMLSTHTIKLFYFTVIFTVIASAVSEVS